MKNLIKARLDEQCELIFEFENEKVVRAYIESVEFDRKIPVKLQNVESEFLTDILKIHLDRYNKYN